MIECLECGAPAEIVGTCDMAGVDFDGADAIFHTVKVECVAGHRYHEVDDDGVVKL